MTAPTTTVPPTSLAPPRPGSGAMFDAIAFRYDLVNRIISFGADQRWRRETVRALQLPAGAQVLDLATGTGDLALEVARQAPDAHIIGVDPSDGMLSVFERKLAATGLAHRIRLQRGEAEALPLPDASVDAITIGFGIRNVPDRLAALREMRRVLKPGGRVAILECSNPRFGPISMLARFHMHQLVPRIGAWLSRAREYAYLSRSIAAFPDPATFSALLGEAGLKVLEVRPMTFGVVCLHVASVGGVP